MEANLEIIEPKPSYYQSPDGSYSFPNGEQGPHSSRQKVRYQAGFKGSYYTLTLKQVYDSDHNQTHALGHKDEARK